MVRLPSPLLFGLALLVGAGCDKSSTRDAGPVDAGPPVLSEQEPNDGPDKATSIERTTIVEANLGADPAKPDVDWYVFKSTLPRTADVRVSCPPGADLAIEVVDETGTVLQAVNAGGIGAPEHVPNLDVAPKAFIRIVAVKKGAGGAYTLTARMGERVPGYELEPNDRRVDATPVPLGQAISGYLAHGGDVDIYRFELPSKETAIAAVEPVDAGGDDASVPTDAGTSGAPDSRVALRIDVSSVSQVAFDVQLLTEAEAVLFSAKSRENTGLSLRNVGVRESDRVIYVVVRSASIGAGKEAHRGANDTQTYTLTVAPEEAGATAELEPNEDVSHATDLSANSYREGFISPKGDTDVFRLVTDGPSIARLQVSGVEKVDLVLSVISQPDGKPEEVLLKANEGGTREPEQLNNVACNGSCFVKVEAAPRKIDGKWVREDENADSSYRLTATVVPDDGSEEKEPNNSAATASPVSFNKPVRGTVYPKKDVDYFVIDLKDREVKTPVKASVTGVLKVDIGLYLHRLEADGKLTLVQTSDSAKGEKPETIRFSADPGTYLLEVRDAKNRESNFQDSYQLSVDEDAD